MEQSEELTSYVKAAFPDVRAAQYQAVAGCFSALGATIRAVLALDAGSAQSGREALDKAIEALGKATEVTHKLGADPEAASSPEAQAFKVPPAEFWEQEECEQLLAELGELQNEEVVAWYERTRARRACVVSQRLRNDLYDAIRARYSR